MRTYTYILSFLVLLSCEKKEIFDFNIKTVDSYEVLVSTEQHVGELLEIDNDGQFYNTNVSTSEIYKYSQNGVELSRTAGEGRGPNEFEGDLGLTIKILGNEVFAHNIGGFFYNIYDSSLNIKGSYHVENRLLNVTPIDNQKIILSYASVRTSNYIEIVDRNSGVTKTKFYLLNHRSPYYTAVFFVNVLSDNRIMVSYANVNKTQIYSIDGKLLSTFSLPGFLDEAPIEKAFKGDAVPAHLLFKDVVYNPKKNTILFLEGGNKDSVDAKGRRYSGSNKVHVLSIEGDYQYTIDLPVKVELIAVFEEYLFVLQKDSLLTNIIKMELL